MNRETINANIFEGLDSINSLGKDDYEEDMPQNIKKTNENGKEPIKKEIIKTENKNLEVPKKELNKEKKEIINEEELKKEELKKEELKKKQLKKEEQIIKEEEDEEDDDDDEKIVVKKLKKIKNKLIYSFKDDIKFMLLPKEKIKIKLYFYFILFIILTSISIISDIFSIIISKYKGQIIFSIIAILLRLFFISSNIITLKYEFEAIIIFQLILNNCLFFYNVLLIIHLKIYHNDATSENFILFCYILNYLSVACIFINIIYLYIKYNKVYVSMTENDIEYLKIYNKRNTDSTEIQLVEKNNS